MKKWSALGWIPVLLLVSVQSFSASVEIGLNFTASTFGVDSSALPPDTTGAIGPNHFVEFVNGSFAVFDKATGKRLVSFDDSKFWTNAGITLGRNIEVTDPRVVYDGGSGRWFLSMVDVNTLRSRANRFLLAVSSSSDPTDPWHAIAIPAAGGLSYFADFPTLGVDRDAVYLSGDLFTLAEDPAGPIVLSIPKSSLLANPPTTTGMFSSGLLSYDTRGDILQPAVTTGAASSPEVLLAVGDVGLDFLPHSTLVLTPVSKSSTGVSLGTPVVLDVPPYEIPINPTQPGGVDTLDNGDARISSAVRRVGDVLYATHCIEQNGRAVVRWYRIDAVQLSLIESGTITNADLELFFPSIAANTNGTVIIGCNGASVSTFVSSFAFIGGVTNGVLTFSEPILLKSGLASYDTHDSSGTSRWGDYSATTVDPNDANRFWTIQAFPVDSTTWATQITELVISRTGNSSPILTVTRVGSNLEISWPFVNGQKLQFTSSLSSPNWQDAPGTASVSDGITTQVVPISDVAAFFRLVAP